jgi:hypothetical protein
MPRGFLRVGVFTLYLFVCACKREVDTAVSPPQSGGVPSVQAEAIPTKILNTPSLSLENVKDKTLTASIIEALAAYDPEFHTWTLAAYPPEKLINYPYSAKSMPYAVSGDYNGDGMEDMILAGHNKNANIIVALISAATGYRVVEVQKASYYSKSREQGKEITYTADGILLFQRKGSRYIIGDMETGEVIQKTDGFAVQHMKWFNHETSEFGSSGRISDVYEWDPATSKFHSNSLEDEAAITIVKYALRTDFGKAVFEEKTGSISRGGASVRVAVKSASGEWLEWKPMRTSGGASYHTFPAGTEIKMIYSCTSSPNPAVNYWKVSVSYWTSPTQDLKTMADSIPNPIISRVLPVGTSFGYYWTIPDLTTEIKKEAVFSYACQDSKLTTVFTVKVP